MQWDQPRSQAGMGRSNAAAPPAASTAGLSPFVSVAIVWRNGQLSADGIGHCLWRPVSGLWIASVGRCFCWEPASGLSTMSRSLLLVVPVSTKLDPSLWRTQLFRLRRVP